MQVEIEQYSQAYAHTKGIYFAVYECETGDTERKK